MLEVAKRCARLVGQGVDKHAARIDLVCHTFAAFTILAGHSGHRFVPARLRALVSLVHELRLAEAQ